MRIAIQAWVLAQDGVIKYSWLQSLYMTDIVFPTHPKIVFVQEN